MHGLVKMGAQHVYCVPDRYFSLIQWWRVRRRTAERDGELLTGLISCECGVEKGREQLLQLSAEHIQHLHSHTASRSIDLTTHTHTQKHTDCAQWESLLVTQEERLCCHSLKSKAGDGVSFDVLYFHPGIRFLYSILGTQISAFISNLVHSYIYRGDQKSGTTTENASVLHSFSISMFICNSIVLISRIYPHLALISPALKLHERHKFM